MESSPLDILLNITKICILQNGYLLRTRMMQGGTVRFSKSVYSFFFAVISSNPRVKKTNLQ